MENSKGEFLGGANSLPVFVKNGNIYDTNKEKY